MRARTRVTVALAVTGAVCASWAWRTRHRRPRVQPPPRPGWHSQGMALDMLGADGQPVPISRTRWHGPDPRTGMYWATVDIPFDRSYVDMSPTAQLSAGLAYMRERHGNGTTSWVRWGGEERG